MPAPTAVVMSALQVRKKALTVRSEGRLLCARSFIFIADHGFSLCSPFADADSAQFVSHGDKSTDTLPLSISF
jgi:hypothetical protein